MEGIAQKAGKFGEQKVELEVKVDVQANGHLHFRSHRVRFLMRALHRFVGLSDTLIGYLSEKVF